MCCERKNPTAYSISLLVDFIKDLDFRRNILQDENEPSMKVFQEVLIHSCVEVAVREMRRQCRILKSSSEHNTSVRITDDIVVTQFIREAHNSRNLCWSYMIEQEQFHGHRRSGKICLTTLGTW